MNFNLTEAKSVLWVYSNRRLLAIESISLNVYFWEEKQTAENHFWKKWYKEINDINDCEWKSKLTNWECITANKNMWDLSFLHQACK